jgi:hypothetical protein
MRTLTQINRLIADRVLMILFGRKVVGLLRFTSGRAENAVFENGAECTNWYLSTGSAEKRHLQAAIA